VLIGVIQLPSGVYLFVRGHLLLQGAYLVLELFDFAHGVVVGHPLALFALVLLQLVILEDITFNISDLETLAGTLMVTCIFFICMRKSSTSARAFFSAAINCTLSLWSLLTPLYMSNSSFISLWSFKAFLLKKH
jgi:hypothetical protein